VTLIISKARRRAALVGAGLVVAACLAAGIGRIMPSASQPRPDPPAPIAADGRFDGQLAFRHLVDICKLGPRISGTAGMRNQQELLRKHFEALGGAVSLQPFPIRQPSRRKQISGANLIVEWHPTSKQRVLLGAHYDTRPIADMEPLVRNRSKPILGANDGASGIALLMELGRHLPKLELAVGVDFVCFDAEEYIYDPDRDRYFLGSEHFVAQYTRREKSFRYDAVIIVDMIGDRDLAIHPEEHSIARSGPLVRQIWETAAKLRVRQFKPDVKHTVLDDHIPLQRAGLQAIVLIDFDYPHWHRLTDTPDRCSAGSLEAVGKVLLQWLIEQR
jgi:hypothetical protein